MGQGNRDERYYRIEELAELGGVTRRTVRYYVQRGLLPTPLGTGRGPHYTQAHLERLIHIRQLPVSAPEVPPERSTWMRFVLADGVELHVRTGAASFQPSQLARLVEAVQQTLGLQTSPYLS